MKKLKKALAPLVLVLLAALYLFLGGDPANSPSIGVIGGSDGPTAIFVTRGNSDDPAIAEDGVYDSKEEVALYILAYSHLPDNYITKNEARKAGWEGGNLDKYCPGKCIGGDSYQNREGALPKKSGRSWRECDIDTLGASSRGGKRLLYSNDGLIYYTGDHYESFTLLYGKP